MSNLIKKTTLAFSAILLFSARAQADLDIDVDLDRKQEWYQNPIYWVIGGVVLILLVALIVRGGRRRD